ncbi:MAG: type II secretion system protein N [Pseudohongiella sp.]|nr:type II secretion system protein N [Pseudohongiella sp.]
MKTEILSTRYIINVASLLVTAGFLIWSSLHVAGMIWHMIAQDAELTAHSLPADLSYKHRSAAFQDIDLERLQRVYALSQIGRSSAFSTAAESSMGTAADTRLALTLRGAVLSSDPARSRAIIANADSQNGYQSGDRLLNTPGTVLVQEIHQNFVLLDNNGQLEILRIDEVLPPGMASNAATPLGHSLQAPVASELHKTGLLPASIDKNSALTDLLRIQPVFEDEDSGRAGALRGLQIRHGSSHDFLIAVGLERGDLITAVDGKQLNSVADLSALMSQLSTQTLVSLQVLRDQTSIEVVLDRSRW